MVTLEHLGPLPAPSFSAALTRTVSQFQVSSICRRLPVLSPARTCFTRSRLFCPVSGSYVTDTSLNTFTPAPLQSPDSLTSSFQVPLDPSVSPLPLGSPSLPFKSPWLYLPEHGLPVSLPPRGPGHRVPAPSTCTQHPGPRPSTWPEHQDCAPPRVPLLSAGQCVPRGIPSFSAGRPE